MNIDRRVVGGLAAVVSVTAFGVSLYSSNKKESKQTENEIRREVIEDGFDDARGAYDRISNRIGKLILGKCEFREVDIHTTIENSQITDITDYSVAVGQVGDGKFRTDRVIINFKNADELQAELPTLNCFPGQPPR